MRAVLLEVPDSLLAERHRTGADKFDEMWEGVLHMVPPPSQEHQAVALAVLRVLLPLAESRGLVGRYETGLFRPRVEGDYRVPDQVYARAVSRRGVEGDAALVVEILSPHDETYEKLDWYASVGVGEVVVVDPDTRAVELFGAAADRMEQVPPGPDGTVTIEAVGVRASPSGAGCG